MLCGLRAAAGGSAATTSMTRRLLSIAGALGSVALLASASALEEGALGGGGGDDDRCPATGCALASSPLASGPIMLQVRQGVELAASARRKSEVDPSRIPKGGSSWSSRVSVGTCRPISDEWDYCRVAGECTAWKRYERWGHCDADDKCQDGALEYVIDVYSCASRCEATGCAGFGYGTPSWHKYEGEQCVLFFGDCSEDDGSTALKFKGLEFFAMKARPTTTPSPTPSPMPSPTPSPVPMPPPPLSIVAYQKIAGRVTYFLPGDGSVRHSVQEAYRHFHGSDLTVMEGVDDVVSIAATEEILLFLRSDGSVHGLGSNKYGQLGLGSTEYASQPTRIDALSDIVAIAAGGRCSYFLRRDGAVLHSGRRSVWLPLVKVPEELGVNNVAAIAAWGQLAVFLQSDGRVVVTGYSSVGALGLGSGVTYALEPQQLGYPNDVMAIACGPGFSLLVNADGTVFGAGADHQGQLGLGEYADHWAFTQLPGLTDIVDVAAGGAHSLFLKRDGSVLATGRNGAGELGVGDQVIRRTPTTLGLSGIDAIYASEGQSLFRRSSGEWLYAGWNLQRQWEGAAFEPTQASW